MNKDVQLGRFGGVPGKVKVLVTQTCPLDKIRAAQERFGKGHLRGKIVLIVGEQQYVRSAARALQAIG